MVTTLEIDKTLLQEALDLSNHPTPNTLIEAALREYIQRRKQLKILELLGTIDYDEDYNYKQQRQTSGNSLLNSGVKKLDTLFPRVESGQVQTLTACLLVLNDFLSKTIAPIADSEYSYSALHRFNKLNYA